MPRGALDWPGGGRRRRRVAARRTQPSAQGLDSVGRQAPYLDPSEVAAAFELAQPCFQLGDRLGISQIRFLAPVAGVG